MSMTARMVASVLLASLVSIFADDTWTPKDSMRALDSALEAVRQVSSLPNLSPEHARRAVQLVQEMSRDIQDGERGNLTVERTHDKVSTAIMTLTSLEHQSAAPMLKADSKRRALVLRHRGVEKHVAVDNAAEKLKLQRLEQELLKKRVALENLINASAVLKITPEDLVKRQAIIDSLNATATLLSGDGNKTLSGQEKEQQIQTTLAMLDAEQQDRLESIDKVKELEEVTAKEFAILEDAESSFQEDEKALAAVRNSYGNQSNNSNNSYETQSNNSNHSIPSNASNQSASASQEGGSTPGPSMVRLFKATTRRQATKMERLFRSDLRDLKEAEASIKKRDVNGLQAIISKMRAEAKLLRPTPANFIY